MQPQTGKSHAQLLSPLGQQAMSSGQRRRNRASQGNLNVSAEVFQRDENGKDLLIRNGSIVERGTMQTIRTEQPGGEEEENYYPHVP